MLGTLHRRNRGFPVCFVGRNYNSFQLLEGFFALHLFFILRESANIWSNAQIIVHWHAGLSEVTGPLDGPPVAVVWKLGNLSKVQYWTNVHSSFKQKTSSSLRR